VERFDLDEATWIGRSKREAPEIDGEITIATDSHVHVGDYVDVRITDSIGADLVGKLEA
jgi:ribosomal protein S12 methylthiotransferase